MFYKPRPEGYKPTEDEIQIYVKNQMEQAIIIQNIFELVGKYPNIETIFNTDKGYWFEKPIEELSIISRGYREKVISLYNNIQ